MVRPVRAAADELVIEAEPTRYSKLSVVLPSPSQSPRKDKARSQQGSPNAGSSRSPPKEGSKAPPYKSGGNSSPDLDLSPVALYLSKPELASARLGVRRLEEQLRQAQAAKAFAEDEARRLADDTTNIQSARREAEMRTRAVEGRVQEVEAKASAAEARAAAAEEKVARLQAAADKEPDRQKANEAAARAAAAEEKVASLQAAAADTASDRRKANEAAARGLQAATEAARWPATRLPHPPPPPPPSISSPSPPPPPAARLSLEGDVTSELAAARSSVQGLEEQLAHAYADKAHAEGEAGKLAADVGVMHARLKACFYRRQEYYPAHHEGLLLPLRQSSRQLGSSPTSPSSRLERSAGECAPPPQASLHLRSEAASPLQLASPLQAAASPFQLASPLQASLHLCLERSAAHEERAAEESRRHVEAQHAALRIFEMEELARHSAEQLRMRLLLAASIGVGGTSSTSSTSPSASTSGHTGRSGTKPMGAAMWAEREKAHGAAITAPTAEAAASQREASLLHEIEALKSSHAAALATANEVAARALM